jgi:hypothetical protein
MVANQIGDEDLAEMFVRRISVRSPNSDLVFAHDINKLFAQGEYCEASRLLRLHNDTACAELCDFLAQSFNQVDPPNYEQLIDEALAVQPDKVAFIAIACINNAIARKQFKAAFQILAADVKAKFSKKRAAHLALNILEMMLLDPSPQDNEETTDRMKQLVVLLIRYLASHPIDDVIRNWLLGLLSVETTGLGIPLLVLIALDLNSRQIKIIPDLTYVSELSISTNEQIGSSIRTAFQWLGREYNAPQY